VGFGPENGNFPLLYVIKIPLRRKTGGSKKPRNTLKNGPLLTLCVAGKSLTEELVFAATNPQYETRLIIELRVHYMKTTSSEHVVKVFFPPKINKIYCRIIWQVRLSKHF
jgi:hypothetical protein